MSVLKAYSTSYRFMYIHIKCSIVRQDMKIVKKKNWLVWNDHDLICHNKGKYAPKTELITITKTSEIIHMLIDKQNFKSWKCTYMLRKT